MTGYFIWVRETSAIKVCECISILKPEVSWLSLTLVCPALMLLYKGNVSRNLPRCFLVPQQYVGSAREETVFNRACVT